MKAHHALITTVTALPLLILALAMTADEEDRTDAPKTPKHSLATFGAGCFWCVEAVFENREGVIDVQSGYAGGTTVNPSYREVCSGSTGHAEVIQIKFDPKKVSFTELVDLFWKSHDPTTMNRQGADVGTQYRSVILYHNAAQRSAAEASKKLAAKDFISPIVTGIAPLGKYYPAEISHQDYYRLNPRAGYCAFIIRPKVEKLRKAGEIK